MDDFKLGELFTAVMLVTHKALTAKATYLSNDIDARSALSCDLQEIRGTFHRIIILAC